jgi:hypothetical protein
LSFSKKSVKAFYHVSISVPPASASFLLLLLLLAVFRSCSLVLLLPLLPPALPPLLHQPVLVTEVKKTELEDKLKQK